MSSTTGFSTSDSSLVISTITFEHLTSSSSESLKFSKIAALVNFEVMFYCKKLLYISNLGSFNSIVHSGSDDLMLNDLETVVSCDLHPILKTG